MPVKILQNAPVEHSAVLLTCIKLSHGFKTFVLSFLKWSLKTGFIVMIESELFHAKNVISK